MCLLFLLTVFAKVLQSCSANFSREVRCFSSFNFQHLFPADFLLTNWSPAHETRCVVRSLLKLSGSCRHGGYFPELRSRQIWTILLPILFSSCGNLVPLLVLLLCRSSFSTARSARWAKFQTESLVHARKLAREHSAR
jgi:hypothetical protein